MPGKQVTIGGFSSLGQTCMNNSSALRTTGYALLLAMGTLVLGACAREPAGPPNIILVSIDTLRWDYLSTYGYEDPNHTPATSRLEANGIVYENAVATAGTTIPSHGSMLTGLYPRMHGARSNFHGKYPQVRTITEALQEAGYQTGAFLSVQFLIKTGLLGAGFEDDNLPFDDPVTGQRPQHGSKTVRQAMEWVDNKDPDRPMFMWMHLWEPHGPYDPTDWSRARMGDYDGFLKEGMSVEHARTRTQEIMNSPEHMQAMRTLYAGEVNLFDQYFGQFLDHLESTGELDNTVIIFTADHGQAMGENGRMGHGAMHAETVIRVPMIVADFRDKSTRGQRIETRVGTVDIAPTIAVLAGLDEAFDFSGRSLLEPEALADDWPYIAEVELRTPKEKRWDEIKESKGYDPKAVAVYAGNFKMTYRHGDYKLYETGTDLKVAKRLDMDAEAVMADYMQGLVDAFSATELDLTQDEISDEDLRILQSLGYVQ